MPALAGVHHARRGAATPPSVRAAFGNSAPSAVSVTMTVPVGTVTGDIGIVVVCSPVGGTINPPAGWTKIEERNDGGTSGSIINVVIFKRFMLTADAGATVTFTRSDAAAQTMLGSGVIVQGGGDVGVHLRLGRDPNALNPNGLTVRVPAIKPGPQDLVLLVGGGRGFSSLALNCCQIATQPTGFTSLENRSNQANVASFVYASWISSAAASAVGTTPLTALLNDQSYRAAGLLAISPAGRRPTLQLPASLQNAPIHGYGTSYMGYASDGYAHASEATFYDRVARAMGAPTADNVMGLPGAMALDICGGAYGTISYYTRAVQADTPFTVQQPQTWMNQTGRSGVVLCSLFENDGFNHASTANGGTTAKSLAGARTAGEALVRLLRASSVVEETHASVVKTGTWTASNSGDFSGGANTSTTTNGDKITITVANPDIDVILIAGDEFTFTQGMADAQIKVNGTVVGTYSPANKVRKSSTTTYNSAAYCQMAIPLRNMGAGTNVIEIIHASPTGKQLFFDGYLIPSSTPPWIVLNKLSTYNPTTLSGLTAPSSNAILAQYSQIAQDIANLFPDGRVLTYDPLENGLWDYTKMVTSYDGIHLNEVGQAHYSSGIVKLLQECVG